MAQPDPQDVVDAVAAWVRAEHHFRFGPNAYRTQETEWYEKSVRKLRRALTGKGSLEEAFKLLGDNHDAETTNSD